MGEELARGGGGLKGRKGCEPSAPILREQHRGPASAWAGFWEAGSGAKPALGRNSKRSFFQELC